MMTDPYAGNARLYNDANAIPLRTIQMQRILILGLIGVVAALGVCLIVLTVRLGSQPIYAFGFDRVRVRDSKSGAIVTESAVPINVQPMSGPNGDMRETDVEYWLPNFVENLFTVADIDTDKKNLVRYVRPFVAPGSLAQQTIQDYLTTYNPVSRGETQHVVVTADPLAPPRQPNVYHVTWNARTTDLDGHQIGATQQQGATITIAWGQPAPTFERTQSGTIIGGNPPGMYVTQIVSDKPLDPRATSVGP
jgi:type IV secretory pathway TrbF-like protein